VKIARVFPRRTVATPDDALSFRPTDHAGEDYTTAAPGMFPPEVDAVHVSVTFDYDRKAGEWLADAWKDAAPVTIGGPSFDRENKQVWRRFTPGMYLKPGYVITSRGCPNKCWFCKVQSGPVAIREISEGWNVLDDNLLACHPDHINCVFDMLSKQKRQPEFTGGLEAARFYLWQAERMREIRTKTMFFAYDTPDDWEPLVEAAELCWKAGFTKASHNIRAYVLVGWPKDSFDAAEKRLRQVLSIGIVPMAMLWRDKTGKRNPAWRTFQRIWARPASVCAMEIA